LKRPQIHHSPIRKQNRTWARNEQEKAKTFAEYLSKVFKPNQKEIAEEENRTDSLTTL